MNKRLNYGNFSLICFARIKKGILKKMPSQQNGLTDLGQATSVEHFLELIKDTFAC